MLSSEEGKNNERADATLITMKKVLKHLSEFFGKESKNHHALSKKIFTAILVFFAVPLCILWLLPLPKILSTSSVSQTMLTDRTGNILYTIERGGKSSTVPLQKIPLHVIQALISTEDRTYFSNPGISVRGIGRALWHNLTTDELTQGGSTITQQLIRTKLQPKKRTLLYKIREAWLALKLTSQKSKNDILENFLNSAYFGHQSYGIKAAAQTYFGKDVQALSVGESSLLIGLLNAPTSLNPFVNPAEAQERRSLVLHTMYMNGVLTKEEAESAAQERLQLSHGKTVIKAPHFVQWIRSHDEGDFLNQRIVRTTLDINLQTEIEGIVQMNIKKLEEKNVSSAAVVVLNAKTGDILSMIGSKDYFDESIDGAVNVATSARQPGSALKPFTYALALQKGLTAATTVADTRVQYKTQYGNPYTPRNYDYEEHGLVRLRDALANSYNIAAVKVLEKIGVQNLLTLLQQTGISTLTKSPEHYGLALTLGDSEVKLLELTAAYGIFAREGRLLYPRYLLHQPIENVKEILSPQVTWLISDILSDPKARLAEFGDNGPLDFPFQVAAKTGTTRNSRDNWTIGYTPEVIVGVWVGNADNSPMKGTTGITGAAPIFHDVMLAAMEHRPKNSFTQPTGLVRKTICKESGLLATDLCQRTMDEWFISGTEPTKYDDIWKKVRIDTRTGLLADETCAGDYIEYVTFLVFPPELRPWAREAGYKEPPTSISPLCSKAKEKNSTKDDHFMHITHPVPNSSYKLDPLIPDEHESIILTAEASTSVESIEWKVNDKVVGIGVRPSYRVEWKPTDGSASIEAIGGELKDVVNILIEE